MAHEFKLPDVGEGVAEGELVEWLVEPSDAVSEDQPVAEVETDKALVEVPSPVNGTVRELLAEEGEMMNVGEVFITFDVEGEPVEPAEHESADAPAEEDDEVAAAAGGDGAEATAEPAEPSGGEGRVFAAPSVRRLARELDVELEAVEGTGPSGRVTESDVRAAAEGVTSPEPGDGGASAEETEEVVTRAPESLADRDRTLAAPATRQLARELGVDLDAVPASEERDGEAFVTAEDVEAFAEAGGEAAAAGAASTQPSTMAGERVPYRGLRRTIGEQMERSAYTAPHVTHHELFDAQPLVEARETLKPQAEERGIRLTYLPILMKAATAALKEFPFLNASLDEEAEEIVLKDEYHLGFAAATDDGLLVPVVDDVDRKGLLQLASEINELAEKARDRSIAREEMQGSTFTITNFGAIGGDYGTPIINYPEVAILGLGAIKDRPYVVDGEVVARKTLPVSLTIDHRVIDGAEAARFAGRLGEYLENPLLLLLD